MNCPHGHIHGYETLWTFCLTHSYCCVASAVLPFSFQLLSHQHIFAEYSVAFCLNYCYSNPGTSCGRSISCISPVQIRKTVTTEWVSQNVSTRFSQYSTYVSIIPLTLKEKFSYFSWQDCITTVCQQNTYVQCLIASTQHKALMAMWTEVINLIMPLFMSCNVIG